MEGASDEQCYHFRRARRPRALDKGLRLRAGHGRGREEIARVRARVGERPSLAAKVRFYHIGSMSPESIEGAAQLANERSRLPGTFPERGLLAQTLR